MYSDGTPLNGTDSGGLGGNLRRQGTRDTRILERAIREQWPVPDDIRAAIVERQAAIATSGEVSPREATSAARCLVSMTQQNQAGAMKALDKVAPDKHEHALAQLPPVTLEQLHSDPNYVQFLEQQTGTNSHPGILRNGHQQRNGQRMENGEAPGDPE